MKSLLAKTLLAAGLSLSINTYAASLTTDNGYTLDSDTNIVTGGGLQWLQWDVTLGMTIPEALAMYSSDGWSVASNVQMEGLFDAFFNPALFGSDENITYSQALPDLPASTNSTANKFINLFGDTFKASGGVWPTFDTLEQSLALFGSDDDADGNINIATVFDEYVDDFGDFHSLNEGRARLLHDFVKREGYYSSAGGVALVRLPPPIPEVPVPAAAFMFAPALLGFLGLRRKRRA